MKNSILIVDDVEINRVLLAETFMEEYDILEAENGEEALRIISENDNIAAVMLDLLMPVMNGIDVLTELNKTDFMYKVPVFIITAADDTPMLTNAYSLGAVDIISKPFRMCFIKSRIENIIELYKHRNRLEDMVREAVEQMNRLNESMVETLATLVEFRDVESDDHIRRIRNITEMMLTTLSSEHHEYHMDKMTIQKIGIASVLHDVGKIGIPDTILKKPGRLTPEEFDTIKSHTIIGCEILDRMPKEIMTPEVYRYCYDICRYHHERWDGNGYPDKLAGDDIPIWAQVVAIADAFDSLTSPRVYKPPFDVKTALNMINNGQCGAFNPKVIDVFNKISGNIIKEIMSG